MERLSRQIVVPSNPGGGSDRGSRTIVRAVSSPAGSARGRRLIPFPGPAFSPEPAGLAGEMKLLKKERVHEYNL
jgi:hypothetical protein